MPIKPFTRKQHYFVLFLLLLITVAPRLQFQGPYLYDGDPVGYFSGAESILEDGKYLIDGKTPIWPVGTSLTLIPFMQLTKALGGSVESGAFWHGMFFIFLAVAFTYMLGKRLFNPATGIIAAIFLSLSESPFIHSINSASDPGSLAMLLGAIYLMLLFLDTESPLDMFLSFFMLGLAFVFRWNYVFFLPMLLIYLSGHRRIWVFHLKPFFGLLAFFGYLLGITIQLVTNYSHFGNPFEIGYGQLDYSEQFVFNGFIYLKNILRIIYRVLFTWDFFSPLLAMFGVLAILGLWKEKRRDVFWLIIPWVVLGSLSVVYFGVKPRLLMPIMPPLYLIGSEGIVRAFYSLRKSFSLSGVSSRVSAVAFILMGFILFSPMFVRTLLHSHGHFQDKVVMQEAFRWAGDNIPTPEGKIITQPFYAGQNQDWRRAGWDVWASKRYSGRKIKSLEFPETWASGNDWAVVNRFWIEGTSLRFLNSRVIAARFDSLCKARSYELKMTFEGEAEPLFLKKLNILTYYPVDFLEYRSIFEVWGPGRKN